MVTKTRRARKLFRRSSGACGVDQSLCKAPFHLHGSPMFNLETLSASIAAAAVFIAAFTFKVLLKDLEHHARTDATTG